MTISHIDAVGPDESIGPAIAPACDASDAPETIPFMPLGPAAPGLDATGPAGLLALARLARQASNPDEALFRYREALLLDSGNAAAAIEAALFLGERGELRDAVEILERSVRREPGLAAVRFHLGVFWQQLAEPAKAVQQLRRYLALEPDDLLGAQSALAAIERGGDALPATFVRALFDQYADDFERNLLEDLEYRGPQMLRQAVNRQWRSPAGGAALLDLGCGTGLGGAAFRDLAHRLHGVDLSPRMVARAAARNIYDSLEVGDAVEVLRREAAAWDLVVAADMLVYLGELDDFFAALAAALRPGGAFAATAETAEGSQPVMKPTRRFGHPPPYLRQGAAAAGLRVALLYPASIRRERGRPVPGHVMVLIKDA